MEPDTAKNRVMPGENPVFSGTDMTPESPLQTSHELGQNHVQDPGQNLTWWRADARTFIMNVWVLVGFILYLVWDYMRNALTRNDDYLQAVQQLPEYFLSMTEHSPVTFYTITVVGGLSLGGSILSWAMTFYSVSEDSVYRRSGLFFKKHRQIRLESVQSVDISRSLIARILGLSELRLEVADGSEEALHIKYLAHAKAQELQDRLMRRVRTLRADHPQVPVLPPVEGEGEGEQIPASGPQEQEQVGQVSGASSTPGPSRVIFKVPHVRVLCAVLLGVVPWLVPVGIFWLISFIVGWNLNTSRDQVQITDLILPLLFPLLGVLWQLWTKFDQGANFTVELIRAGLDDARGDSLRLTYGFTGTHTQTLFPARLQAIKIEQPLLWRPFGWYRVLVNIAGVAISKDASSNELFTRNTALPVGTAQEVHQLLHLLLPDASPRDLQTVQAVMDSSRRSRADSRELGVISAPPAALWLNPLTYVRDGFARVHAERSGAEGEMLNAAGRRHSEDLLLLRGGRLLRFLSVVPERQVLTVRWSQGPMERILKIARLSLGNVAGPVRPAVQHLRAHDAEAIAAEITARADGTEPYYRIKTGPSATHG